ncbi:sensor histidine kinase [Pontibacter sp. MBLB2868]|uniref:sensor histidine kinase n=1 Tax=Pontibacter sp. MBLB2868 TaxID=3451555 RepID=UPI003F755EEC
MNRIKRVFRLIHVVLWLLFSLLISIQLNSDRTSHWQTVAIGFILTCLYVFYSHFLLLTRYLGKNKKRAYFLKLSAVFLTGPILFVVIQYSKTNNWEQLLDNYSMSLITAVPIFIFLSWLARITENLVLNTIRKEQLEKQAFESELYYLKSQINPHFLFNTLNNIHTLVYKQAPKAPEAVLGLSSLMRYMIYESNAVTVPLSREMVYVQDYISLQQLRYKKSPVVDLEKEGDITNCAIAPLLFIHLLENAYKHSPARLEPGDIKVRVAVKENTLTFSIQNPIGHKPTNALEGPGGIGLPNVRKRLQLLYPGQHVLEINSTGEVFCITLKIFNLQTQVHEGETQLLYN